MNVVLPMAQNNTSPDAMLGHSKKEGAPFGGGLMRNVMIVKESAKMLSQTSTRQAGIALWEREMKGRKEQFGIDLYPVMERYRSMGEKGGGETDPHVVEVFQNCVADISRLLEKRKGLQAELLKMSKPKALCYQTAGESTVSEQSAGSTSSTSSTKSWFQMTMEHKLQKAKEAVEKTQSIARIKTRLMGLDKEMNERQKLFGVQVFEVMAYLTDNYEPQDSKIRELFDATKKDIAIPLAKTMQAEKEIHDVRTSGEILLSHADIHNFIAATPTSWAMLQVNIGIPEEECKNVAYRVSLELASGKKGEESRAATISKKQFEKFQRDYITDPKGSQEFFHRCVFAAFDNDANGVLDKEETDKFLDTFYVTGSIFHGDGRLPEKEVLKKTILDELDKNGDGLFDFDEIRSLISGSAARGNLQH